MLLKELQALLTCDLDDQWVKSGGRENDIERPWCFFVIPSPTV